MRTREEQYMCPSRCRGTVRSVAACACVVVALSAGCVSRTGSFGADPSLRTTVLRDARTALALAAAESPFVRPPLDSVVPPERLGELSVMSGPGSYSRGQLDLGAPLGAAAGAAPERLTLGQAIAAAAEHNLGLVASRLGAAAAAAGVDEAVAAFDWGLFADAQVSKADQRVVQPRIGGSPLGGSVRKSQSVRAVAGARVRSTTGARLEVRHTFGVDNSQDPTVVLAPDPARTASVGVSLTAPLLRGGGSDVNLAGVRLAERARSRAQEADRAERIQTLAGVETAYWRLAQSQADLRVRQRLLDRGIEARKALQGRASYDARPAALADAGAQVQRRRADVTRARAAVRDRSDVLKSLLQSPGLPLVGERVIQAVELFDSDPVPPGFTLAGVIESGLQNRPDMRVAELSHEEARILEKSAADGIDPRLDLRLSADVSGLGADSESAYDEAFSGGSLGYSAGILFEQPLGNRVAEAQRLRRKLDRVRAATSYAQSAQLATLEIKSALRSAATDYRLIAQRREARFAAAENLRSLTAEMATTGGAPPALLDLLLRRQEALAFAELEEIAAVAAYAVSLSQLRRAVGSTLLHWGIEEGTVVPAGASSDASIP